MTDAKYTTLNQFASMLEKRSGELYLIAQRLSGYPASKDSGRIIANVEEAAAAARLAAIRLRDLHRKAANATPAAKQP